MASTPMAWAGPRQHQQGGAGRPSTRDGCDVDFLFGAVIDRRAADRLVGQLRQPVGGRPVRDRRRAGRAGRRPHRCASGSRTSGNASTPSCRCATASARGRRVHGGRRSVPRRAEIRLEFLEPQSTGIPGQAATSRARRRCAAARRLAAGRARRARPGPDPRDDDHGRQSDRVRARRRAGPHRRELPDEVNRQRKLLARSRRSAPRRRAQAWPTARSSPPRSGRPPQVAWVARPVGYRTSAGVDVGADRIDLLARIMSMGKLHHVHRHRIDRAGGGAALPGTVVTARSPGRCRGADPDRPRLRRAGRGRRGARTGLGLALRQGRAVAQRAPLMSGWVHLPASAAGPPQTA